jgi:mRNA-decapping enzyme subunit 2
MTNTKMTLVDWLDDLCVRFIVNLPNEELQSVERICFQIEEAQWFYEDFIRPLDPNNLPSMHLRKFSQLMFQHCPLFSAYSEELHQQAYEQFLAYKTRVPVRGAIMLNQDMTHAVLVKGWKKGAKWSFPRGKINKEEADLDCAVREVWEETGFDLQEANLVLPDEDMKKITVTMREQSMMLYVFRGVPMDTYFEPRTRKEISKIDWYKLTDLPTLRRKNQAQPQSAGQDMIKESSFYMVAPFLGPLRAWIKQQHKLDRQRTRSSAHLSTPVGVPITDDEEISAGMHEAMTEKIAPIAEPQPDMNFADLVAQLRSGHRPSDTLPELSTQPQAEQSVDPAAELKRLLSVGMGMQSPPVEAPAMPPVSQQPQVNPLLALFHQGNNKPASPQMPLPRTPFDQVMPPPMQPHSPHGQHHPRPPQNNNMPPPPFPFPPHQGVPFHGPQPPFNNGMHAQMPQHFMLPPHHQNNAMFQSPPQMPRQQVPPSFQQSNDNEVSLSQSFQASQSQSFGSHGPGPAIPPASKLPAPKLNAHTLGLLNSFRVSDRQSPVPDFSQTTAHAQSPPMAPQGQQNLAPRHYPNELSSPHFQSPPINIQPAQPKPRSAHQDSLLTLFRDAPPTSSPEPAELSALPNTPGYVSAQLASKSGRLPNMSLLDMFGNQPKPAGITSATVRGPVNAPDFDTMKKNTLPVSGSSRGPSPFVPQQILKREQPMSRSPADATVGGRNGTPINTAELSDAPSTAFKPQILKRPQQSATASPVPAPTAHAKSLLDMFKGPSPQPAAVQPAMPLTQSPAPSATTQQSLDRQEAFPSDQKNALLALFSKPSPKPEGSRVPASLQQTHSPIPTRRSPLPPTPKTTMSGVISPVSPLPEKGSQAVSPTDFVSRSRISSIGDSVAPSIVIPPTSHPLPVGQGNENLPGRGSTGGLSGQSKSATDGKSPVDKTFLLGFLEDVARRGR